MNKQLEPVLNQRVFEARYEQGYRYLDRCGDAMVILEDLLTEQTGAVWLPAEATPASARIKCPDLEITIVFSAQSLVVDQTPISDVSCDFAEIASACLATITGRFDLRTFRRLGSRRFKVLPAPSDSIDAAEGLSATIIPVPAWLAVADPSLGPRSSETSFVFETPDRSKGIRISTKPYSKISTDLQVDDRLKWPAHHLPSKQREALLEQLKRAKVRQHDPEAGVMIDVDYYWMWPKKDFTVKDFLAQALEATDKMERALLSGPAKK